MNSEEGLRGKACASQDLTSPTTNKKMVGNKRNGPGKKLEACKGKRKVEIKEKSNRKHNL